MGTRIYNKTWGRLKQKSHKNPRSEWVIVPNAFKAVVNEQIFKDANERLYWMFSSNWRKGINATKRARKLVSNYIFQWLLDIGLLYFEAYEILSELPIIFSVKHENTDIPLYCFLITEKNRRFDNVLAISVVPDNKKMIDDFFLFSIQDFIRSNYLILSKNNYLYHASKIEGNRIEETIKLLIHQLKNSCQKYNSKYPTL